MARKPKGISSNGAGKAAVPASEGNKPARLQWVNPYLGDVDKSWLKSNSSDLLAWVGELLDNLSSGESLSTWFDYDAHRYVASVSCRDPQSPNHGFAISIRGATRLDALYALAYLVRVRFDGAAWNGDTSEDGDPWG